MKWFYQHQKEAEKLLKEHYEPIGFCAWQDVTKERVYESWTCKRKSDSELVNVITLIRRVRNAQGALVIIYEQKH